MTWLRRNAAPIGWVLLASAVVIAAFELIDSFSAATPVNDVDEAGADLEGIAALAGLIKVALFMAIPAAVTLAVRSRFAGSGRQLRGVNGEPLEE